jgi:hypothetical protein
MAAFNEAIDALSVNTPVPLIAIELKMRPSSNDLTPASSFEVVSTVCSVSVTAVSRKAATVVKTSGLAALPCLIVINLPENASVILNASYVTMA